MFGIKKINQLFWESSINYSCVKSRVEWMDAKIKVLEQELKFLSSFVNCQTHKTHQWQKYNLVNGEPVLRCKICGIDYVKK